VTRPPGRIATGTLAFLAALATGVALAVAVYGR
jgi:hypothetical protein